MRMIAWTPQFGNCPGRLWCFETTPDRDLSGIKKLAGIHTCGYRPVRPTKPTKCCPLRSERVGCAQVPGAANRAGLAAQIALVAVVGCWRVAVEHVVDARLDRPLPEALVRNRQVDQGVRIDRMVEQRTRIQVLETLAVLRR